MRISRRHLLIGAAAVAAAGSAGVLWFAFQRADASEWIEAVVRKNLPNVRLDSQSLHRFSTELALEPTFNSKKMELALGLDSLAPSLLRIAPEVSRKIERLERLVVSNFLLSSNFFRVADPSTEAVFSGAAVPACGNPFARFLSA